MGNSNYHKKVILLILDGWGLAQADPYNAVMNANTPVLDELIKDFPNERLKSSGESVGLPEGQCGTSEVNHQVIGTGRVLLQELPKINTEIENGKFFQNPTLLSAIKNVNDNNSSLHIAGVMSDGKVHASLEHTQAIIKLAAEQKVKNLYVHFFSDGRDTPPKSAEKYIQILEETLKFYESQVSNEAVYAIATIQGRYFLDRDRDWDRTAKAINLFVDGEGDIAQSASTAISMSYRQSLSDEYMNQYLILREGLVKNNDSFIFTHYRTDRSYQILKALDGRNIEGLRIVSFVPVSDELTKVEIAFNKEKIEGSLAQVLSESGKSQLHLTETEKYTHLTYFFNGGREQEYPGENWMLLESNRFVKPFYQLDPAMRLYEISEKLIDAIEKDENDFIVVNFSNLDMVGHTGKYEAALSAMEAVDFCVGRVYKAIKDSKKNYALIVTADHGNAEIMWDYENNQPHTQHTTGPVPVILVSGIDCRLDRKESLEDIAPTVLDLMGITPPSEMTGTSLIILK